MESTTWPETLPSNRIQAIQELNQGQKLMNNLYEMLQGTKIMETGPVSEDDVVVQILGLFENTLSIISSNDPRQHLKTNFHSSCNSDGIKSNKSYENLTTLLHVKTKRGCDKRSKTLCTSTQLASDLIDDGHAWRKYGQKQILNSKHQRSYYRCTYKFDQGCPATKHVQKIMDNPTKYKITYMGRHTCKNLQRSPPIILDSMNPIDTSLVICFETKGFIENKQINSSFPSIKHEQNDGFYEGDDKRHNMSFFSDNHVEWDPSTHGRHVPLGVNSGFKQREALSVDVYATKTDTYGYETDHMFGRNDFNDFPYELCF